MPPSEEKRFLMRPERDPLAGRRDELRRLLKEKVDGERTIWAGLDWATQIDLDATLRPHEALAQLVDSRQLILNPAVLEKAAEYWTPETSERAQALASGTGFQR